MVESNLDSTGTQGQIILCSNRSASWRTVKLVLWLVSTFAMIIALSFAFVGLWMVLPFAGLEVLALVGFMYWVALQCRRQQVIHIGRYQIVVEQGYQYPKKTWESELFFTRLVISTPPYRGHPRRLFLHSKQQQLEIGEFLNDEEKNRLIADLRGAIKMVNR